MTFQPSVFQQAIFDFIRHETGSAIVEAVAGSGKTKTMEEAFKLLPRTKQAVFLAFNKSIATELKQRGLNARTFHSITMGPVMGFKKVRDPELDKLRKLCRANMDDGGGSYDSQRIYKLYASFAMKLVGLAKQVGIGCLIEDTAQAWYDIVEHHDIAPDNEDADVSEGVEWARKLLGWSNDSPMVDFDDMLYLSVKENINLPKFDVIFVDEAQDTNAIQRALIRKMMREGTRIIAVGDPAQAIYGFRGADNNSLNMIAEEFSCTRLPLSITYRCATSVVTYAQQWVRTS